MKNINRVNIFKLSKATFFFLLIFFFYPIFLFQVGNCVGKRNYRYFYLFLVSLSIHCLFILGCVVTHLVLCKSESILYEFIKNLKKKYLGKLKF